MNDIELSISLPLDSDGFLRRACPTCERELKWKPSDPDKETDPAPELGYFCPYCGQQAPPDSWWTEAQIEMAKAHAYREIVGPEMNQLADSLKQMDSGFLSIDMEVPEPEPPEKLEELDDMKRIDFPCHQEPVKIAEHWEEQVHCPLCGATTMP